MPRHRKATLMRIGGYLVGGLATILIASAGIAGAQARPQRNISVSITDTTGKAISGAEVTLRGTSSRVISNERGEAVLQNVDWGSQQVIIRKLGFREGRQAVVVPAGGSVTTTVVLVPAAVNLTNVVIEEKGGKPLRLSRTTRFDDFYARRKTGAGTFFTREDIEARNPGRAMDLFLGVSGIRLTYRGNIPLLSFARCKNGVEVFVDGQRLNDGVTELSGIHPGQIEAVEIYHGLASVPPQFSPKPDDCAAIVIWTRYF